MKIKFRLFLSALILYYASGHLFSQTTKWTLKSCLEQALEKNVLLNQSRLNNEVNKINFEQSKANKYPNLNLSENHNFSFGRAIDLYQINFLIRISRAIIFH